MAKAAHSARRFRVHARHLDRHHARVLEEVSFEAAAIAYVENFVHSEPVDDQDLISVIVHDLATGDEHSFRIDLGGGKILSEG